MKTKPEWTFEVMDAIKFYAQNVPVRILALGQMLMEEDAIIHKADYAFWESFGCEGIGFGSQTRIIEPPKFKEEK